MTRFLRSGGPTEAWSELPTTASAPHTRQAVRVSRLTTAGRITLVLSAGLLAVAVVLALTPVNRESPNFECGTVLSPDRTYVDRGVTSRGSILVRDRVVHNAFCDAPLSDRRTAALALAAVAFGAGGSGAVLFRTQVERPD